MTDFSDIARRVSTALGLRRTPVAVSFSDNMPANHVRPTQAVSAGCQFWELGMNLAVTTDATDHKHCAIGIHTHNLKAAPQSQNAELSATLAAMQGLDYVREDEVAQIPVLNSPAKYASYLPLKQCNVKPALVLLFANGAQGLTITEAIARVDGAVPLSLGRPACALVPHVVNSGLSAASLGCCGARAYLDELDDSTTIWALNGEKLSQYCEAIETLSKANDVLSSFHTRRRQDIEKGQSPTVNESLNRLSQ